MSYDLKTHRHIPSGKIEGTYPHIVLKYKEDDSDKTWFVDLDTNNQPYRVSNSISKYKSVNFDSMFPLKMETDNKIKELIEFENKFEILKKSNCVNILSHNFVQCNEVGEFFNSIFRTENNGIMFGPGGHGKSEMAAEIIETADLHKHTFIKSFGEGTNESSLYGGINMRILRESGNVEFNLSKAFTSYEIVLFEELFDAPSSVLLALKDALTSGFVHNGAQREPIKCRCIIGLTNKAPSVVATDDSRQALTERFPLQVNVKWDHYNAENYEELIRKKYMNRLQTPVEEDGLGLNLANSEFYITAFAEITEKASKNNSGKPLSPRVACHGFTQIMASIKQNRYDDRYHHFGILKFVAGYEKASMDISERVKNIDQVIESRTRISEVKSDYDKLYAKVSKRVKTDPQALASLIKEIDNFRNLHKNKTFHDTHIRDYENMWRNSLVWRDKLKEEIVETTLGKLGLPSESAVDGEI